jgi:hypothetical protein
MDSALLLLATPMRCKVSNLTEMIPRWPLFTLPSHRHHQVHMRQLTAINRNIQETLKIVSGDKIDILIWFCNAHITDAECACDVTTTHLPTPLMKWNCFSSSLFPFLKSVASERLLARRPLVLYGASERLLARRPLISYGTSLTARDI